MERLITATTLLALATAVAPVPAQTLRGSRASVEKQYEVAVEHDYSFLSSTNQVKRFANNGLLVSVPGNANYELSGVSYPFARPAVKTFVERLSSQYRSGCGERLVVTSLTRPTSRQPRNASDQSVHPAGMAVDLRISRVSKCRSWLERVLLELERKGVVEATRERYPAHYHVAVFPTPYLTYVGILDAPRGVTATKVAEPEPEAPAPEPAAETPAPVDVEAVSADAGGAGDDPVAATSGTASAEDVSAENASSVTASAVIASAEDASAEAASATTAPSSSASAGDVSIYRVSRGDTLWGIARVHGVSVSELKALNGLRGSAIKPGQRLKVPHRSD